MSSDPHGRLTRADGARRRRPPAGFRVRDRERFRLIVQQGITELPDHLLTPLRSARLVIDDVPPLRSGPAEAPPFARFTPARSANPGILTVYRRPLELRAGDRDDLTDLARFAAGTAVAEALGLDASGLDPPWEP